MLGLVVLIDVGATVSGFEVFARVAYWSMAVGVVTGLATLTVQLVDLVTAPAEVPGRPQLGVLNAGTTVMVVTFAATWSIRVDGRSTPAGLLALEVLGYLLGLATIVYARWFLTAAPPPRPAVAFPNDPYPFARRYPVPSLAADLLGSGAWPAVGDANWPTVRLRPLPYHLPAAREPVGAHDRRSLR
jgi:hypothetical protein